MDNIFHFNEPTVKSYKKKNLSLIPINLIRGESDDSQSQDEEEDNYSPVIHKAHKKSKFATSPPIKKSDMHNKACLGINEEDLSDEEESFNNSLSSPSIILDLKENISMASKNIHSRFVFNQKSKLNVVSTCDAIQIPDKFSNQIEFNNDRESEEIAIYEKILSQKNLNDCAGEDLEECNNDESVVNRNLKSRLENMDLKVSLSPKSIKLMNKFENISSDNLKKPNEKKHYIENFINNHSFRHLIFAPYCTESTFKKHLTLTYRGLVYSRKCLKGPSDAFIKSKQVSLVESKVPRYKTLLLDLDETLIHSCPLKDNPEHLVKTADVYGNENTIGINIRPFCFEFLEKLCKYYEIFIFTAATPNYANAIVNYIDPDSKYINGVLTRQNCMETKNGFFVKDLRIIKNRELKNMILVDNLAHSFGFQINNGIPILEWHNNKKKDAELKFLLDYLIEILYADDIREFNKRRLKLHELSLLRPDELF